MMQRRPRIAALVDLSRETTSGGHVKYWERLAQACAKQDAPIDLTVYFSGTGVDEYLSPHVRFRFLPPVFSTARLKFLPYVPAHTDLAPFHPALARELQNYDCIHTTDGYFAFARTAERVARRYGVPLVTSFHTDTPAYAEIFTQHTLQNLLGERLGGWVDSFFKISKRQRRSKEARMSAHMRACKVVMIIRSEDISRGGSYISSEKIRWMRKGVDKDLFKPQPAMRAEIERDYNIAPGKFLVLFVGRVDVGKNMPVLLQACAKAIEKGAKLHLFVVGLGPMSDEVKSVLGENATMAGLLSPEKLAKIYAAVDCLAVASQIEIGGLISMEAIASGCPVLVSKKSGIATIFGNPAAMKVVDDDVSSWADSLMSFASDKAQQAAMRAAAVTYRNEKLAGWGDVLREDFLPVWQSATQNKET
jgi:glycosyltransferase involved in cell wall biosynthesis